MERPEEVKCRGSELKDSTKQKGRTGEQKIGNAGMGCGPSQAVIIQQQSRTSNGISNLQPAIFMVAEESIELLRDLGELKLYHLAQYGEAEQIERLHGEFAKRLMNPVESVRNELESGHSNQHGAETAEQSLARDANNSKTSSVHSRVCKVEKTTIEVTSCSNPMPSPASSSSSTTEGPPTLVTSKDLTTSSMFQNECLGDMVAANPGRSVRKLKRNAANYTKDLAPPSSCSSNVTSAPPAQTPCTTASETRSNKTKTFFGRNRRVEPKAKQHGSSANTNRYFPPLGGTTFEPESTAQGREETEMKHLAGHAWSAQ